MQDLYQELTTNRGYASKPCLLGRSRGGLLVTSWAIAHPDQVAGIAGIYPVFDLRSYPGLERAAGAYSLNRQELESRLGELNPIAKVSVLAAAKIPVCIIHGDSDKVVPLEANSGKFAEIYKEAGSDKVLQLIVPPGQGHSGWQGFFQCRELVDFAIERAKAGAK